MKERTESAGGAALISVSDRTGVVELARALVARGTQIFATGGTCGHLREHGIDAREVEELTGFPALFGGRVKTLHPNVFGGILADRDDAAHRTDAQAHGIAPISTVVVNLYPFESTVAREETSLSEAIEQIDIGGVALIRAAAKNFAHVTVLVDPACYARVLDGEPDLASRRLLATRAFERTAEYDASIARYMAGHNATDLPGAIALTLPVAQKLRYGENPQSRAAFYLARTESLPEQLGGKELSYNNLLDLDATLRLLVHAPRPPLGETADPERLHRAAIVKHTVPCGVSERAKVSEAVGAALDADPVSAFGGIVAVDGEIDDVAAEKLASFFLEIVAAPAFTPGALVRLRRKKNLRLLRYDARLPQRLARELQVRSALGGVLAEDEDPYAVPEAWRVVSQRAPNVTELTDLRFAWDIVRHVKSNGVVVARDRVTRGICAGQTNRVSAVRMAGERAGAHAAGSACASDGFFPFPDGLEAAAAAGCTAVVAPGGAMRDGEVIARADALGIALVFSTYRYFLH